MSEALIQALKLFRDALLNDEDGLVDERTKAARSASRIPTWSFVANVAVGWVMALPPSL